MKAMYTKEVRTASQDIYSFIAKQFILIIFCSLPYLGLCSVTTTGGEGNPLILEINMVPSEPIIDSRLRDTLSVSILETTSGDKYVLNTTTGSISISLSANKHYFIYMSKTGSLTQGIEFHTLGSENSHSRTFFVDYEPEEVETGVNDRSEVSMSVVKFANDANSSVLVDQIGISVFYD